MRRGGWPAALAASLVLWCVAGTPVCLGSGREASGGTSVPPSGRSIGSPEGRRVVLVVVDGLDARDLSAEETPTLARAWRDSPWCPGMIGRAAMPARTNVNHATLLTGIYPEIHGIVGNAFWDRGRDLPRKLGAAVDFLTETLFTVARQTRPDLRTGAALGKGKLALMFAGTDGQAAPTALWGPQDAAPTGRDPLTGYAYDMATLAGVRTLLTEHGADFLLVNLADVDRVSHGAGPRSPEAARVRRATDALIAELLDVLRTREDWLRTTVIITADHGMDTVLHPAIAFGAVAAAAGLTDVVSVGDGGVGHVYLRDLGRSAESVTHLAAARRLALSTPGIAEALYLAPNGVDGGSSYTVAAMHPDWRITHPRSGDLLLIGAPGSVLLDGGEEVILRGNHGGPAETRVPVIVVRDGPSAAGGGCDAVTAADLGRTVFACLGLRDVERVDRQPIPAADRGRVLPGLCR